MLSALLLVSSSSAHVSLVPNSGAASGGYFQTSIKIPHGHKNAQGVGMHTTRMVLHVPKGILSIRPEPPVGWTVETTMYDLAEEDRYTSHGNLVTTGVDKITFTADSLDDALHNDHLMLIGLQLKIGCSFKDQVKDDYSGSHSIWQGQHTLWFKVDQYSSDGSITHSDDHSTYDAHSPWKGALKDNAEGQSPSWNPPSASGYKACPYLFIYAGSRCSIDHSGEQGVPPPPLPHPTIASPPLTPHPRSPSPALRPAPPALGSSQAASPAPAVTGGMEWMNAYVAPVENMGEVKHEQHVINLATEAALDAQESLEAKLIADTELLATKSAVDDLKARLAKLEDDNNTLNIAVAALALAATALGVISLLCVFRVSNKKQVAHTPLRTMGRAAPPCHAPLPPRPPGQGHTLPRSCSTSPRLATPRHASRPHPRVGSSPTPSRGCPSSPPSLPSRRPTPRSRAAASPRVIPPLDKARAHGHAPTRAARAQARRHRTT